MLVHLLPRQFDSLCDPASIASLSTWDKIFYQLIPLSVNSHRQAGSFLPPTERIVWMSAVDGVLGQLLSLSLTLHETLKCDSSLHESEKRTNHLSLTDSQRLASASLAGNLDDFL